jgi:polyamine oxidase
MRQQALANQSITDFLIVEYNGEIGGRVVHTDFGKKPDGSPYVIELGANWVQGLGTEGGPENPIWTLVSFELVHGTIPMIRGRLRQAKKYNISNTYSNYSSILTYNETGYTDYASLIDNYETAYAEVEQYAGYILTENLQDSSMRGGLSLKGFKPKQNMAAQAAEWWSWDWETSYPPDQSSLEFGIVGYNATFYRFSEENNLVTDQRGFNALLKELTSTFLTPNDKRLLLNTIVADITYNKHDVTITNADGSCISAAYAICTFSLGVLQNEVVNFEPKLPEWKQTAIADFQMGTYTKIFLQFNETFWDPETQFFLYASPTTRGYYPVWQSLSMEGFLPGSNIIFATLVERESYRIEAQDDEVTKAELLAVLREMFPDANVPEPIAFLYPRWTEVPWAYGSYSNWPVGTTLENHQNLRANVGRLYFAGEATSTEYFGFLHGAYFEGQEAGLRVAGKVKGPCKNPEGGCGDYKSYEVLHGTTELNEYNPLNGWDVSSFFVAA